MRPLKFIISGGGTGGHIFPAIAIANALKELRPDSEFLFVGAKGRMEMEKVPSAGYKIEGLWISGLQRKLTLKNLMFPFKVISSILKAKKILKEFRPDAAIGTGGYASGPMLNVASGAGVVTVIQEQNSYAGITNKLLSKKVDKICVAYEGMEKFFPKEKIVFTGNPVRQDIIDLSGKREIARNHFNVPEGYQVVLVIGGSLGARTINESISSFVSQLDSKKIFLIWQTGKSFLSEAQTSAAEYLNIKVFDFISRMDLAYAASDIVISRAGASSISELAIVGKPSILVPSPNVAEDHQTKNAMSLVKRNAALIVKDSECREKLFDVLKSLSLDRNKLDSLSENISSLAKPGSAKDIATEILKLIERKNGA